MMALGKSVKFVIRVYFHAATISSWSPMMIVGGKLASLGHFLFSFSEPSLTGSLLQRNDNHDYFRATV